jgi:hypothetical protein
MSLEEFQKNYLGYEFKMVSKKLGGKLRRITR